MQKMSCDELRALLEEGAQIVDVRTPMEFYQGAVPGAVNLPVQAIQQAPGVLDTGRPVIVYCRTGQRSAFAKAWLENLGFHRVVDLHAPYFFAHCLTAEGGREVA
jgi:rhodanese-related sulfurtransferase